MTRTYTDDEIEYLESQLSDANTCLNFKGGALFGPEKTADLYLIKNICEIALGLKLVSDSTVEPSNKEVA